MIETPSLYEILDLKPDASPQEVREAYLRTKLAYNKDSVALYTLISAGEREEMLQRIEEAYDVLSNADRRREYDRRHGLLEAGHEYAEPAPLPLSKKIISIDRVPPMESTPNSESLLVAPPTDFTVRKPAANAAGGETMTSPVSPPAGFAQPERPQVAPPPAPGHQIVPPSAQRAIEAAIVQEIAMQVEWRGSFLRRVREARRISLEDLSNISKVSKTYLQAIEEENYAKLPAPVFIRGFVNQIARTLKLPHEQVVAAYMARFLQARPDDN